MGKIVRPITPEERIAVELWMKDIFIEFDTVCNRIRKVYNIVKLSGIEKNAKKDIIDELKNIMIYTKRMDNKLKRYSCNREYEI